MLYEVITPDPRHRRNAPPDGRSAQVRTPAAALAASTLHYFDCKNCHKVGMAIGAMGATNTCLQCHANGSIRITSYNVCYTKLLRLTPGQTYYFTMKTWDVAGNVSTISDMVSAVASGDSADPDFGGVNWAAAGDESATINRITSYNVCYTKLLRWSGIG